MNQDRGALGREPIGSLFRKLAIPAVTAQLINMLYNVVDRIYIGHIPQVGYLALTGVGVVMPIVMAVSAFASLVALGGVPLASMAMGREDYEKAHRILGNSFSMILITSLTLSLFISLFKEPLALLLGASQDTLPYSLAYLRIYGLGTLFVQISLGLNAYISAQGFAKTAMKTVALGALLNIILDPIFIFLFKMGVQGAALATILSQGVSALWVLSFFLKGDSYLKIKRAYMPLEAPLARRILGLGLSPFIMTITESILVSAFNANLQRYGGDLYVGVMTVLSTSMQFAFLPLSGMTQGAQPIVSYNYGAGNQDRVKAAFRLLIKSALVFTGSFFLAVQIFPALFIGIFSNSQDLIRAGVGPMRIYFMGLIGMGVQVSCQQTFLALGQARTSIFLALLRKVIMLIPFIYIFPLIFEDKIYAIFLAEPVADIIAALTTLVLFIRFLHKELSEEAA
ncbi:MAG: MATE family efflux transporter [Tissierellia bacterium]|nr:MATE family efflux transporter [Tissierellia bacterium]